MSLEILARKGLPDSSLEAIDAAVRDGFPVRAALHPARRCGDLDPAEIKKLHRETVWVASQALAITGATFEDPPTSWLFQHRWKDGGICPRTKKPLERATIGGRTTCWSPARQKLA
jgi:formamidopyrimidine-DNA glycosylase